jgi:hypothetical protein
VPLIKYLFPSQIARLSVCIPKSENGTQPVVLLDIVWFPVSKSMASPVSASIEPVNWVALHVEGTRQVDANVQDEDEVEFEASPASAVRLPHDPLYVNTCTTPSSAQLSSTRQTPA